MSKQRVNPFKQEKILWLKRKARLYQELSKAGRAELEKEWGKKFIEIIIKVINEMNMSPTWGVACEAKLIWEEKHFPGISLRRLPAGKGGEDVNNT